MQKNDFVRKNFKGYISDVDKEYAVEKYGMNGQFYKMFYNFPLTKEMLDTPAIKKKDYIKIQINNSCDKSTLEMLDILSKFKDEDIKVTTVLSYGKLEYKDAIISKGKTIFGNNFEYVDKIMSPQDYAVYLAQNDILIFNQDRQQGFGNILASLYLGKKVYIRRNVSLNKYLNNEGIKIYDSEDIVNINFQELVSNNTDIINKNNVKKYFDDEYLKNLLENIFQAK